MGDLVADVSRYNTGANFSLAKQYGLKAVIVKASESTSASPAWTSMGYPAAVKRAGLVLGSYHFLHNGNARSQMEYYVRVAGKRQPGDLPNYLDIENYSGYTWTRSAAIQMARDASAIHKQLTGQWPGIYCSDSFWRDQLLSGSGWLQPGQQLWDAHYGKSAGTITTSGWDLHQYTGSGSLPGLTSHPLDLSVTNGSLSRLLIGGTSQETVGKKNTVAITSLKDDYAVLVVWGTTGYMYYRLINDDGSVRKDSSGREIGWVQVSIKLYGSPQIGSRTGSDLWVTALGPSNQVMLISCNNIFNGVTSQWTAQDIGGIGSGAPDILCKADRVVLTVPGVSAGKLPRGEIFVRGYRTDKEEWSDWTDMHGQSM